MRIAIACGGTGGHFYPGYVLGQTLRRRGHEVLFVLRRDDPAAARLEAEDLPFTEIDLRGLPRKPSAQTLVFLWKLAGSLRVTRHLVAAYRPGAVAGMGGYLTFPLAFAACSSRVPIVLHESNSVLGLANRLAARRAWALALGLPLERPPHGVRSVLTGTPVRPELWSLRPAAEARSALGLDPDRPTLLVFGGSQGAHAINRLLPEALKLAAARRPDRLQVLHLTGAADRDAVPAAYAGAPLKAVVRDYLPEMHLAYAACDLALCRSGASTLAELIAVRRPALLVPYPSATGNHQEHNARVLERAGAAEVLLERALEAQGLARRIESLLVSDYPAGVRLMAGGFARLELPEPSKSAEALADLVEQAGKK